MGWSSFRTLDILGAGVLDVDVFVLAFSYWRS